jgi:hypothetical protein
MISGCVEYDNEKNISEPKFYDISLANVTLTEKDFSSAFSKMGENYTTNQTIVENMTGNGVNWTILEQYYVFFYSNITNGVMETLLKLESDEHAYNLTILLKDNYLTQNYTQLNMDQIGDISFLLNMTLDNDSQYYYLVFSIGNIFIVLGGSAPEQTIFINYAKIIENKINELIKNEE